MHDPLLDGTLALVREGYTFIFSRCLRHQTEIFRTRVLGREAICLHGRDANALFYDETKLVQDGASQHRALTSLFGKHDIQTLDGEEHRQREAKFLALMAQPNLEALLATSAGEWHAAIERWERAGRVVLFDEAALVLTRACLRWAGVPFQDTEAAERASDFVTMEDAFGAIGPRAWRSKLARRRTEAWLTRMVERVRNGELSVPENSALGVFSRQSNGDAHLLARTAAGELIDVIRPMVAVAWYIAFAVVALHRHPNAREQLAGDAGGAAEFRRSFLREVQRFYPVAPYLGAKVRSRFTWHGVTFEPGTLVLLDLYGNQHDPELWDAPESFRPERFANFQDGGSVMIPEGDGAPESGRRCAGEWITTSELDLALTILMKDCRYELDPSQDLGFDLRRTPARPRSGVVLHDIYANFVPRAPSSRWSLARRISRSPLVQVSG